MWENALLWENEQEAIDEIKKRINDLLWISLPGEMTLAEADRIAMEMLNVVVTAVNRRKPAKEMK